MLDALRAAQPVNRMAAPPPLRRCAGVTLIEVLVAVLIVGIGVLGIVELQLLSMQTNAGALYRTEANQFIYDIIDRARANPAGDYTLTLASDGPVGAPDCAAAACDTDDMADYDVSTWLQRVGTLPRGDGAIAIDDGIVTVTVEWDDDNDAVDDPVSIAVSTQLR
jgi:type IV pilus assembly protein PilV